MSADLIFEPWHEKNNNLGFRTGPSQTSMYGHRSRLIKKPEYADLERRGIIYVGKTKTLISCAVTAQLVCVFGFAYNADSCFSDAAAHFQ